MTQGPDDPADPAGRDDPADAETAEAETAADEAAETEAAETETAEDAAWRELVANYGERAVLDDGHPSFGRPDPGRGTTEAPANPETDDAPVVSDGYGTTRPGPAPDRAGTSYDEERFVPPIPAPVALPQGPRLAAWSGVVVPPAILLACALLQLRLPSPLGPLLVIWFLTGFGWLVWHMPRGPRAPWDDGAQV